MAKSQKTKIKAETNEQPEELKLSTEPGAVETIVESQPQAQPAPEVKETVLPAPEPSKPEPVPAYRKELDKTLSFQDRIIAYLQSRSPREFIRINDFLKSLYGLPRPNHPPLWGDQGSSKRLRVLLEDMQRAGQIRLHNNCHDRLGRIFYEGEQQVARFYTLENTPIEAML